MTVPHIGLPRRWSLGPCTSGMLRSLCHLLFTAYLEQPICPLSRVNEAKKNVTQQMKQFIGGCVFGHLYLGRGRAQRGSVSVMMLRGCGGDKHNRACTYRETLRCVRINILTRGGYNIYFESLCFAKGTMLWKKVIEYKMF
jgi:hypothetical protein